MMEPNENLAQIIYKAISASGAYQSETIYDWGPAHPPEIYGEPMPRRELNYIGITDIDRPQVFCPFCREHHLSPLHEMPNDALPPKLRVTTLDQQVTLAFKPEVMAGFDVQSPRLDVSFGRCDDCGQVLYTIKQAEVA